MKKLFSLSTILLIAFVFIYSCSTEEEDTTPPPSVVATPEPEPAPIQYTLTVTAEEGGTVSTEGGTYDEGTEVTITATPDDGYEFVGWFNEDGGLVSDEISYTVEIGANIQLVSNYNLLPIIFSSKSPRYSQINETTSNFYNQFYFESYMTRDTHESLRDNYNGFSDSYLVQENDAVYYDFDKNGSLDLFGFQYWSNGQTGEWGTKPGRYFLISDYSWGKREKVFYDAKISFPSTLDLADLDGDSQLEIIAYSYNVHQNTASAYNSSLPELPIEVIKLDESLNFLSSLISDPITSHDGASGDIDNDGDVDIMLYGLVDSNSFGTSYYENQELLYPHFLLNNGNMNFELSKVFTNDFTPIWGEEAYNQLRTTFYDLIDINGDNFLDIVESYYVTVKDIIPNGPNRGLHIYWGDGTGKFDFNNSTTVYGNNPEGYLITSLGATYLDYDLDGDLDIFIIGTRAENGDYVSSGGIVDTGTNFYENYILFAFKNNGDTFEDATSEVFDKSRDLTKTTFSHFYDINARDVDGDGDYDLVPAKTTGFFIFNQLNNLYWENNGGFFSIREEGGYNTSVYAN